jgi:hypothetical protein
LGQAERSLNVVVHRFVKQGQLKDSFQADHFLKEGNQPLLLTQSSAALTS